MSAIFNTQLFKKAVTELVNISDSKKNSIINFHIINENNIFLSNMNSNGLKLSFHFKTAVNFDSPISFSIEGQNLLKAISMKNSETEVFVNSVENILSFNGHNLSFSNNTMILEFEDVQKEPVDISEIENSASIFNKVSQKDNTYIHYKNEALLYADPFYLKYHICKLPSISDCSFNVNNLISLNSISSIKFKNADILHFIGSNKKVIQYLNLVNFNGYVMRSFVEFPIEKILRDSVPFEVRKSSPNILLPGEELLKALNSFLAEIEYVEIIGSNKSVTINPLFKKLKNPLKVPQPISIPFSGSIDDFNVKVVRKHLIAILFEGTVKFQIKQCSNIYAEAFEIISVNTRNSKGYISTIKAPDLEFVTEKIQKQLDYQLEFAYLNV